jgi:hypothetical protein
MTRLRIVAGTDVGDVKTAAPADRSEFLETAAQLLHASRPDLSLAACRALVGPAPSSRLPASPPDVPEPGCDARSVAGRFKVYRRMRKIAGDYGPTDWANLM